MSRLKTPPWMQRSSVRMHEICTGCAAGRIFMVEGRLLDTLDGSYGRWTLLGVPQLTHLAACCNLSLFSRPRSLSLVSAGIFFLAFSLSHSLSPSLSTIHSSTVPSTAAGIPPARVPPVFFPRFTSRPVRSLRDRLATTFCAVSWANNITA